MGKRFEVGQIVALRADPSRSGAVIVLLAPVDGSYRYRVFHEGGHTRDYYEEQLVIVDSPGRPDVLLEAITRRQWLEADVFRARLTASRLKHPQVDNLYALQAARIRYVPFQYKPLLRFLRADRPRLLIADEVGVGKTIEAGLIFKEMQARQELGNVLIVCPKALVSKWHLEMRRFDEEFRPLTSETLKYCLKESYLDGVWPTQYSRAIAHLELLRTDDNLAGSDRSHKPGLLTLDPAPRFDLVIVDEAHHLRNPGTNSYELARFLGDASEAMIFLSATPVHLGSRNLFSLLGLLRPDVFRDEAVFEEMVEPNRYITGALRHVRGRTPRDGWQREAASSLEAAADTTWGRKVLARDPRFTEWLTTLHKDSSLLDGERIRCLRDLEEVHTLAHVMNRTRRRDVGRFTLRDPRTVSVQFTPEQQLFYDALVTFRREALSLEHDPRVARLVSDTLERQAASCLPALAPALDGFLETGRFSPNKLSDDIDAEDALQHVPTPLVDQARQLRLLAANLPPEDPKLDQLRDVLKDALSVDGPGKVLVFSFFLHTLAYLEENLSRSNLRVATITGDVADDERERLRDRFRLPRTEEEAIDVLLSSEVGSEGLDYEFCDRLVNYDIPWNPMRVEQRIGRIDRYGQASDKVLIFNFITPGTVEERVFFRCFERLGVFRDTVGDLEEVLGEVVEDLSRTVLDQTLTPEQAEERAVQTADNAIRLVEEQRRLEEANGSMLGLDPAFVQEVDALVEEGRFVAPDDIRAMITGFLNSSEVSGTLSPEAGRSKVFRLRIGKEGRAQLSRRVRALRRQDRSTLAFSRWLDGGDQYLSVTFDRSVALENRDMAFVTPMHPLSRVASDHWTSMEEPLAAHLLIHDKALPEGRYAFACDLWETVAVKPEIRIVGLAWDLDNDRPAAEVSTTLSRSLVRTARQAEAIELDRIVIEESFRQLDAEAYQQRQDALRELRNKNARLAEQQMASLDAYHQNRLQRVAAEASQATDVRIARMKEAEKDRIERDYERRRAEITERSEADVISDRIAAGILEVRHGE